MSTIQLTPAERLAKAKESVDIEISALEKFTNPRNPLFIKSSPAKQARTINFLLALRETSRALSV